MRRDRVRGALLVLAVVETGCAVKDPLYCDENTPCTDPALPFCDLQGEYPASEGIKRTCIPDPSDAGPDQPDAGPACTPGEWTLDTVHSAGNVGFYSALVSDSSGTVHVAYLDSDEQTLLLASGRAGAWETDDPGEPGGGYVRMRLDEGGTIHLVHGAWPAGLRYLTRESDATEFDVEGASGDGAYDINFDLDPAGRPVICYTDFTNTVAPKCIRRDSPTWQVLPSASEVLALPYGFEIDSLGTMHLLLDAGYVQGNGKDPWSDLEGTVSGIVLVLDSSGVPLVAYGGEEPRLATREGVDDWRIETIDPSAIAMSGLVLGVGMLGSLHVAYEDEVTGNLKYAVRDTEGDWQPETIDTGTVIGHPGAIFVDSEGGVHITYSDSGNRDLKYGYRCPRPL
jgi:hypothetical protein